MCTVWKSLQNEENVHWECVHQWRIQVFFAAMNRRPSALQCSRGEYHQPWERDERAARAGKNPRREKQDFNGILNFFFSILGILLV